MIHMAATTRACGRTSSATTERAAVATSTTAASTERPILPLGVRVAGGNAHSNLKYAAIAKRVHFEQKGGHCHNPTCLAAAMAKVMSGVAPGESPRTPSSASSCSRLTRTLYIPMLTHRALFPTSQSCFAAMITPFNADGELPTRGVNLSARACGASSPQWHADYSYFFLLCVCNPQRSHTSVSAVLFGLCVTATYSRLSRDSQQRNRDGCMDQLRACSTCT